MAFNYGPFKMVFPRLLIAESSVWDVVHTWLKRYYIPNIKMGFIEPSRHTGKEYVYRGIEERPRGAWIIICDNLQVLRRNRRTLVGPMDCYCHGYTIGRNGREFIPEGIDWGKKPNAVQWLLAGINGVQNAARMATALVANGSWKPTAGSDWEKLITESNAAIDGDGGNVDTIINIIEEQLLRLGTSMDYIK